MLETNFIGEFGSFILAAIGGFTIGAIAKVIQKLMNWERDQTAIEVTEAEMHLTLREELRKELAQVKGQVESLQRELDEWKEKYYTLLDANGQLKLLLITLIETIENQSGDIQDMKNETKQLVSRILDNFENRTGID